ncbi:hypothetical protein N7505_001338 [Penicillium chrysogenum]|uniref:Subtelomeric hrmA-associated cluster protein AFUB-079030/YDR124W-like helical bundle domain-containing protein n=1 Tax=Penicillium chrysogenum TaxID=5076 RepID=A0ABQ8WWL1_PENCH|nr:hypothetical protein N7505_001338 [Penicillium chrysogenum]
MNADTDNSMGRTPVSIDGDLGHSHFALISIDIEGSLHLQCSRSVEKAFQGSLSVQLADALLKAVTESGEVCSATDQAHYGVPALPHQTRNFPPAGLFPPTAVSARTGPLSPWEKLSWKSRKRNVWSDLNRMWRPEVTISIVDRDLLRKYYKAFQNLQQTNCRALAKAYIKWVEPCKQVYFPYNGRTVVAGVTQQLDPEATKPPWWPRGVRHREPDHLLKEERIRLLIHILCELRASYCISAKKLREADQQIRRHIFPAARLLTLDEIYRVRREEEDFLEGKSESIPFGPASPNFANTTSACVKAGSTNNAPPALFAPVANFRDSPQRHKYDVQGRFPGECYAGLGRKTIRGFDMTVPISMPPKGLKRKRGSEEISHADVTRPAASTHGVSPSVTARLQPHPVEHPGESCSFLQQGVVSPGGSTTKALAQPKEGRDISYHFSF